MTQLGDVPPPSWRTQIGNALYEGAKWPPDQVNYFLDQLLDEHAHKLAEQIRESAREAYSRTIAVKGVDLAGAWMLGHDRAAALIDQEGPGG